MDFSITNARRADTEVDCSILVHPRDCSCPIFRMPSTQAKTTATIHSAEEPFANLHMYASSAISYIHSFQ